MGHRWGGRFIKNLIENYDERRKIYCWRIVKLSATPLKNRLHMVFCNQGTS